MLFPEIRFFLELKRSCVFNVKKRAFITRFIQPNLSPLDSRRKCKNVSKIEKDMSKCDNYLKRDFSKSRSRSVLGKKDVFEKWKKVLD